MSQVYHHCATAARDAGQKEKETMYKKKSLASGGSWCHQQTFRGDPDRAFWERGERSGRECQKDGTAEQDDESFCKPDGLKVSQLEEH